MLTEAVDENNKLYASMMGSRAAMAGLSSDLSWSACHLTSTTPVDCDLTVGSMKTGESYMISAHNPSTVKQELLRFKVNGSVSYKVFGIGAD